MTDAYYMQHAIELAKISYKENEVPVGAVIVYEDKIISVGYNLRETSGNALYHAEILAIESACRNLRGWRLHNCTLYVTLEPCVMCAGAIINSRIKKVVYGAKDHKAGSLGSVINLNNYPFNHKFEIVGGVCVDECSKLLSDFFSNLRKNK